MALPLIDTLKTIQTPEGVEIHLPVAGIWVRACAWFVDLCIRGFIYILLSIIFQLMDTLGNGLLFISIFCLEWFYPVIFEVTRKGRTPGKKIMGIQVINDDGTPISWTASMLRNLLRVVDFLPFCYALGIVSILLNRHFKRIGDFAAGSIVIYDMHRQLNYHTKIQTSRPLPLPLNDEEQQALISFAGRLEQMNSERANELTKILHPLLQLDRSPVTPETLVQFANELAGKPNTP